MNEVSGNAEHARAMHSPSDVQAAIDAGTALADPKQIDQDGRLFSVTVPNGGSHRVIDLEHLNASPRRAKGTYRPATVDSLIDVIQRHSDTSASTLWVHPTAGRIVAVFNDNDSVDPGWRDHKAELQLLRTDEWNHWVKLDGQLVGQAQFAEHIEDGMQDITDPPAADMLELAQTIQAAQAANFRQATRLIDGRVQVRYEETIDAKAGESGQLDIPSEFTLAVAPFLGEQPYALIARFRYRLNGGKLSMGYRLDRPDAVTRDALDKIAEKLRNAFPGVGVFTGEPGA